MSRYLIVVFLLGTGLMGSCLAQSIADVSRQLRAKQTSETSPKKVITDDDLPRQDTISGGSQSDSANSGSSATGDKRPDGDTTADKLRAAEQFKTAIQQQKQVVDKMQKQLDKLRSSIHYVEANAYYNGVEHNEKQARKQQEAENLEKQLNEEKAKLQDMQEQAHKEGFGSKVYE